LSTANFNSQCDIVVRNLGFLEVHQDFQSRKRNAFGGIDGWNALRVIPAPIKPRALAAQIGVFPSGQAVSRQI
jgi:hypothetical protein